MQLAKIKDANFIVLHGEADAGKTTTLNELIISLLSDDRNIVRKIKVFEETFKNFNDFDDKEKLKLYLESIEGKKQKKNKEKDHIYFFEYNEKHILVITEGDDKLKLLGTVFYAFFVLDLNVNIVVCAARESFYEDFTEDLSKLGVNNNNIDIGKELQKGKNKNDDTGMATTILEKIDNLIQKSGNIKI